MACCLAAILLAGVFVVPGLLSVSGRVCCSSSPAWWQVHISREGQITGRFTRAVDQLGNSQNVDVRVGGIYALERIARDSETDRNAIQFLLGTFIRNHANWPTDTPDGPPHPRLPSMTACRGCGYERPTSRWQYRSWAAAPVTG